LKSVSFVVNIKLY